MKKLSIAKFGGGLLDQEGKNILTILERVRELEHRDDLGPIVVFSALKGYTDDLIRIGESHTQSKPILVDSLFKTYEQLSRIYVKGDYSEQLLSEIKNHKRHTNDALILIDKRFHGNVKAKVLTSGGELSTTSLS